MNDEIEKKRQEKIANFKINFDAGDDLDLPEHTDITSSSLSSESDGAVFENNAELDRTSDISSGEEN